MPAAAPPAADTRKPATPPPAKVEKPAEKKPPAATPAPAKAGAGAGQQRFDRMAVRAKLAVTEPGDAVEREADAMAERVMRAPAPGASAAPQERKPPAPAQAPKAPAAAPKPPAPTPAPAAPQAGKPVQRQAAGTARPPVSEAPGNAPSLPSELLPRLGGGEPLDAEARAFFEQRLGRDLSGVRVHTDDAAADAARSLQARAFTWGNHVAFASGEYQPASERGRTLIAHELAHVLQNESAGLRHVVARKDNPKYKDPNDISQDAFDPAEDKKKRPLMETLKLPAIKSRHADYYKKLAGKSLKRPAGYDRKKPPFQPEQVKKWKENVKLEAYYAGIGFAPGAGEHTLPFHGSPGQKISGKQAEVIERLQIPSWTPEGTWLKSALQVDHVVELQVGGHDEFYNYELLTGAHNMNVGSLLRGTIYAGVKGYLGAMGKNTGDKLVKDYLEKYDVEFKAVEGGGEGRHLEATSRFWARTEITAGKHLAWLKGEQVAQKKDGSDKSHFALYSYTGQAFIDAFPLSKNKVSVSDSGRLAGIRLGPNAIRLNPGFDKGSGGTVGSIKGTWELPKQVQAQEGKDFESPLNAVPNKPYAGSLSSLTPPKVDAKGASPVSFEQLDFVRGRLTADGILTTSHPLFPGIQIPVRWRGDDFAFEYTFQPTQLKLPVPGLTVDEASVTLFFGTRGVGADGMIAFTVAGLGSGLLTVGVSAGPKGPALNARGSFTADRKLFDLATLEIGYDSEKGFHGKGTLGITNPQKIKGIKSARLTAGYKDAVFSATGEVQPDIPGLKGASLSVSYGKDTLQITGKLGVDERVPGVQSADITVDVKQVDGQWKVAASGEVVPKLPGLSGATLKFSYDEGFVLVEGSFEVKKGPLHGKVQAGVTNAEVDAKGQRAATGAGKAFHVFGAADIDAEFIKNKLTGKLKLRLLPDGQVRVGGGLAIGDFEVFPQIPKQAEFFKKSINTPRVPIPGLGFSVGSVSVGVTVYASGTIALRAAIGPGTMKSISVTVDEFDPANVDFNTLTIRGGATFDVMAQAGVTVGASVHLNLSALIAELEGEVGVSADVGIPPENQPVVRAKTSFTYSAAEGLDIESALDLKLQPALKFALKGGVKAKLNLLIDSITVWSRDWTLGEARFNLPLSIKGHGQVGYNTRTGKLRSDPNNAIEVEKPKLDADTFIGLLTGDAGPAKVQTTDREGRQISPEEARALPPVQSGGAQPAPNQSVMPPNPSVLPPNQSVMAQRQPGATAPPTAVDEGIVARLGPGAPLDLATRGFFEHGLKTNLAEVRVHTGLGAQREARSLGARAFTVGRHIAFAADEYQPASEKGRELLAHELAHVVQQRQGAARAVMRQPPGAAPPAPPAAGSVAGATPAGSAPATPAAAGRGPITIPSLKLPTLKYGTDLLCSHRRAAYDLALTQNLERPAGYRRAELDSRQRTLWTQATPANTLRTALTTKVSGLEPAKVYIAVPRSRPLASAGNQVVVGTQNELALALRQPRWDRQGQADDTPLEIDHIVELQLGGESWDRLANLELLERAANGASGRAIDAFLDQAFASYAASPAAAALPAADRNADVLKRQYRVRFGGFAAQGAPAAGKRWTLEEVTRGDPAEGLDIYDPSNLTGPAPSAANAVKPWPAGVDPARYTGSPSVLVLYATARGGEARQLQLQDGQPVNPQAVLANLLPGIATNELTLTLSAGGDGPIGRVRGALTHPQLGPDARIPVDIPVARRRGLANAGVLNTDALGQRLRTLLREAGVTGLSPIVVDEVDILPGVGLFVSGRVEPEIEMLRGAYLDFQVRGNELVVSRTFQGGDIRLGGPFRIDGSDLTVGLSTRNGLQVDGGVAFSVQRLGQGSLRGRGRSGEFAVDGRFDFDPRLFDADAHILLAYRRGADAPDGKLSGSGTVTIGPGKVRGIRRATVQAAFDGEQRSIGGTAELDVPGVESATLGVQFTPEGGTEISGSARFRDRPGMRNGQISAVLAETPEGWRLSARGGADASFAGIDARLDASYDDGLFQFSAEAPFQAGERVSGRVRVGLTNGNVDDEGRLVEGGAGSGTELRPFGNGTVNLRLTDALQGGVGIRVRPNGDLSVSGMVGLAAPVTLFEQFPAPERATRTLFAMPTISVPLLGVSVGSTVVGVALTINGRVTGHAHVGPGQLTQTELRVDDWNPAQPDSLHVSGDAEFQLPARAGVGATLDAGLTLGAAVINATAGISASASAELTAQVTPHVHLDWRAATGLHVHAALDASLSPRLAFDLNGFAQLEANALVTTFTLWRKDWNLARREIGSSLALRLHAPVDYYSDGRGVVFDPEQVRFEVPSLNADTLDQLFRGEGGSERVERAPERTA